MGRLCFHLGFGDMSFRAQASAKHGRLIGQLALGILLAPTLPSVWVLGELRSSCPVTSLIVGT